MAKPIFEHVRTERNRLEDLLAKADVPKPQRDALQPILDNLAWQKIKLDEARSEMMYASLVCKYDNGGGQTGERENPLFKGYATLWRGYMAGMEKVLAVLPKDLQTEAVGAGITVLEEVLRAKAKA